MKRDAERAKQDDKFYKYLSRIKLELARTNYVIEEVAMGQAEGRRAEKYYMLLKVPPPQSP